MFGGSWLETTKSYITIDVVDPQITVESLQIVFGSLYNDEVILNPKDIVPVLAAATMFQLDGIIEKCTEVMMETINPKTVFTYYDAASQYGHKKLKEACIYWFLVNLMTYYYSGSLVTLRTIPVSLMISLVANPDLFVMQTEFSIYVMLKFWMYMHLHPDLNESPPVKEINTFYCSRKGETAFLLTKEGEKFKPAFRGLRLHNLISHYMDVEMIERDNIVPQHWLNPVVVDQWKTMLKINQNEDSGPSADLSADLFLNKSLRCGRILNERGRHMWRWTGFHYGIDLLMITDCTTLSIKRNHRPEFEQLLSQQNSRNISIRVTVVSLNEQRQVVYKQTSEMRNLTLTKSEEITLMTLDKDLRFPLIISTNVLFTTPNNQELQEQTIQTIG
ncbi:protein germ cell-less [Agrilus planipennis]|uniref:Protein germ cell-less n=1 Tax=Agrilus planipennis TaxID=224129 RepID=A0A7F5RKJ0_AGRPL|nr:protein germ cell-less [Agrilus planipennis]